MTYNLTETQEFKLVCSLLGNKTPSTNLSTLNWEKISAIALDHRVVGQILVNPSSKEYIPAQILLKLKSVFENQQVRSKKLQFEQNMIQALLKSNNIRPVILKGPALSGMLYGDPTIRPAGDLDWLIPIGNVIEADSAMKSKGYQEKNTKIGLDQYTWKLIRSSKHELVYIHPITQQMNEIHWRLYRLNSVFPWQLSDEMFARSQDIKIGQESFSMLSPSDLFIYLCHHGCRHRWISLHWLMDIQQMLLAGDQYYNSNTKLIARKYGLGESIELALALCQRFFDTPIETSHLSKKQLWLQNETLKSINTPKHLAQQVINENFSFGNLLFFHKLRTSPALLVEHMWMMWNDPNDWVEIKLPHSLFWLYPTLKPLLWVKRKIRSFRVR